MHIKINDLTIINDHGIITLFNKNKINKKTDIDFAGYKEGYSVPVYTGINSWKSIFASFVLKSIKSQQLEASKFQNVAGFVIAPGVSFILFNSLNAAKMCRNEIRNRKDNILILANDDFVPYYFTQPD